MASPNLLKTVSLDHKNILENITAFLLERKIYIEDISVSSYQTPYQHVPVFSTKFILLIPSKVRLLAVREELFEFCDKLNIDSIIQPINY